MVQNQDLPIPISKISPATLSTYLWAESATIDDIIAAYLAAHPESVGLYALKTADETVNNSTVLQNDDELVIPVGAGEIWELYQELHMFTATATPHLDWAYSIPVGGAIRRMASYGATVSEYDATVEVDNAIVTDRVYITKLQYIGGANAGNLQLQWAQHTATVEDTKVLANSFIFARKIS